MQYGIRSVTMDDVARESSMSKKTLYQFFDNKDSLVSEVALHHFEKETKDFQEIEDQSQDAIHEIISVSKCLREHVFQMNPSLLFDMQKYHRKAWDEYLKFKNLTIRGFIERNIDKGKKEGYFRKEIDSKVLSLLRVEQVQMVFDTKLFPKEEFDFAHVQIMVLDHFIHGLLTDKGKEKYQQDTENDNLLITIQNNR